MTRDPMRNHVTRDARRRLRAQRRGAYHPWLGLVGAAGWMIALPTVGGALLGRWLDAMGTGGPASWTLTLLLAGLAMGCIGVWHWLRQEGRESERDDS
jgi:ATP synthase protein I